MSTNRKRKYGQIRAGAETSVGTNDDVFDKFFSPDPAQTRPPDAPPPQYVPDTPNEAAPSDEPAPLREPAPQIAPAPERTGPLVQNEPAPRHEPRPRYGGGTLLAQNAAHLRFPYEVLDDVLSGLDPYPRTVLLRLYRLAAGWDSFRCHVSLAKLVSHCKIKKTKLRACLKELESEGYIRRISMDVTSKNNDDRGMVYEICLPRIPLPQRAPGTQYGGGASRGAGSRREPNKDKDLKENSKKGINRLTPEEIQSFTATVTDLLGEGQSIEKVEARFAPTMHAVDWATIRSTALAASKKGKRS